MLRVGFIGTGVMGLSMCKNILAKSGPGTPAGAVQLTVYNRTVAKTEPLRELGALVATSIAELARNSDVLFSIVGYPADVESVYFGSVLDHMPSGGVICDMTTSTPTLAVRLAEAAAARGLTSLDAPVSGGDVGARNGTLSIMVGGNRDAFSRLLPLFETMGKNINHMGAPGSGQHTKMCNQILIATTMIGLCESLLYAQRAGLNPADVIAAVQQGAAGSWSLTNYGPRILAGNFDPGFMVEHFVKDMGIALEEAARMNLSLPGLALANQLYISLKAQGGSRLGTQSLYKCLENMNRDLGVGQQTRTQQ